MALLGMLVIAAVAICGLTLLLIGVRGRLVNQHPHCRRCRFDLIGLSSPDGAWRGKVCPECGADLSREGAVRDGLRLRRGRPLWSGAVLLLIAALGAGTILWGRQQGQGLYSHFPTWALFITMNSAQGNELDLMALELRARAKAGNLSAAQVSTAVAACLKAQADPTRAWAYQCGAFVEEQRSLGAVPEADWMRYLSQAMLLACNVRPVIVNGDVLPMELVMHDRMGRTGAVKTHIRLVDVMLDGRRIDGDRQDFSITPINMGGPTPGPLDPVPLLLQVQQAGPLTPNSTSWIDPRVETTPGRHKVETVWAIVSGDNRQPGVFSGLSTTRRHTLPPNPDTPRQSDQSILHQMRVEWVREARFNPTQGRPPIPASHVNAAETVQLAASMVHLTSTIEVVTAPPSSKPVSWASSSQAPNIAAYRDMNSWNYPYPAGPPEPVERLIVDIRGDCPAIAADLVELRDGKEVPLAALTIERHRPGSIGSSMGVTVHIPRAPAAGRRTFILRPREELARRLVHAKPLLAQAMRFEDVPEAMIQPAGSGQAPPQPVAGTMEPGPTNRK